VLPAQIRVRVLNASGQDGAAGQALAGFQRHSFAPAGTDNTGYLDATEIHYRPGNENKAFLVAGYMQGVGKAVADDSITDADVVVYIGKDFKGVKKLTKKDLATTTTTKAPKPDKSKKTSTTTAPSATGC
jgi:hypothetical protein